MNCPTPEQLSAFFDGETADRELVENHLSGCAACRLALADLRDLRAALAARDDRPTGTETEQALVQLRRKLEPSPALPKTRFAPAYVGALAGLLFLAFGLGWFFGRGTPPVQPTVKKPDTPDRTDGDFNLARFDGGGRATVRVVKRNEVPARGGTAR
jgi:anti-sigma factor RsiW